MTKFADSSEWDVPRKQIQYLQNFFFRPWSLTCSTVFSEYVNSSEQMSLIEKTVQAVRCQSFHLDFTYCLKVIIAHS